MTEAVFFATIVVAMGVAIHFGMELLYACGLALLTIGVHACVYAGAGGNIRARIAAFISLSGAEPSGQNDRDGAIPAEEAPERPQGAAEIQLSEHLAVLGLHPDSITLLNTAIRRGSWCSSVEDAEAYFGSYSHELIVEELQEIGLGKHQSRTLARLGKVAFATTAASTVRGPARRRTLPTDFDELCSVHLP